MKLHQILIGIIILGMISSGLAIFISQGVGVYHTTDYNESQLQSYDAISELNNQLDQYRTEEGSVGSGDSNDILGSFFTSAYRSARIFRKSTDVMEGMITDGVSQTPVLGSYGDIIKVGLIAIIGISMLVGIFLHFITKSERT